MSGLDIIRGDIAFYACLILSAVTAGHDNSAFGAIWLLIGLFIFISGKIRIAAIHGQGEKDV